MSTPHAPVSASDSLPGVKMNCRDGSWPWGRGCLVSATTDYNLTCVSAFSITGSIA